MRESNLLKGCKHYNAFYYFDSSSIRQAIGIVLQQVNGEVLLCEDCRAGHWLETLQLKCVQAYRSTHRGWVEQASKNARQMNNSTKQMAGFSFARTKQGSPPAAWCTKCSLPRPLQWLFQLLNSLQSAALWVELELCTVHSIIYSHVAALPSKITQLHGGTNAWTLADKFSN